MSITCRECNQTFSDDTGHGESWEFDNHDCPGGPEKQRPGESSAEYIERLRTWIEKQCNPSHPVVQ